MEKRKKITESKKVSYEKLPPIVYGLKGIMDLFKVGKSVAFKYRHGIIADACVQQGNKILVDTKKALELYGLANAGDMVESFNSKKMDL